MITSPLDTQQKRELLQEANKRARDGLTFFISFWNATVMNFFHFWKYI